MGKAIITRKGGVVGTKEPTLTFVSKDDSSITFTITNNDTSTADIFWEVGDTTPDANSVELASGATSGNITASGLTDNTTYTISVFANAAGKAGSATASLTATTDEIPPVTLGVEWDQDTDSLTRLDDAVGLTAGSDFDGFNHYQLRRCMVNDDLSINYYIDPDNPNLIGEVVNTGSYTTGNSADYTGSHGQVMVEIPKFWWKTDEPTSDQYQWRISDQEQSGYSVHPAFITDGVTKDYIYMSAFEGNVSSNVMRSISGVSPTVNYNIVTGRGYAQARGTGWQLQTYWAIHALEILYLIEYADFDSRTTIGRGVLSASSRVSTGQTISLGNSSGAASGTDGEVSISYRGVENFWSNTWKFVDGLNVQNGVAYVANENFTSDTFSGDYTSIGSISTSDGNPSDIQFPHFLSTELSGSRTTFLHTRFFSANGTYVAAFGNFWTGGDDGNAFCWYVRRTSSESNTAFGSRLQIL